MITNQSFTLETEIAEYKSGKGYIYKLSFNLRAFHFFDLSSSFFIKTTMHFPVYSNSKKLIIIG